MEYLETYLLIISSSSSIAALVFLLDQLLSRLDLLECHPLGRPPRLTHPFGMSLPLGLALFVPYRRHKRPRFTKDNYPVEKLVQNGFLSKQKIDISQTQILVQIKPVKKKLKNDCCENKGIYRCLTN